MNDIRDLDKILKIKVIGVGGAGNNAITRMIEDNVKGVSFYMINTETGTLKRARTSNILQIGVQTTRGLGAGANEIIGERAAIENKEDIKQILSGADLVFITAGMGGGTGTGAAPIVAEIAKEMGILTIGIVTKPFSFEGKARSLRAEKGTERLKNNVDDLIVVLNDNLLKVTDSKVTLNNAFSLADDILEQGITSITDLLTSVGEVNIDFADIKTTMGYRGKAYMGIGRASGEKKVEEAVKQAIENPLTESKIDGAKGVIFNVKGNNELSLMEINSAVAIINEKVSEDANIIFGTVIDEDMEDEVQVTVIATGVEEKIEAKQ
jgi:cell division protein FtsZ